MLRFKPEQAASARTFSGTGLHFGYIFSVRDMQSFLGAAFLGGAHRGDAAADNACTALPGTTDSIPTIPFQNSHATAGNSSSPSEERLAAGCPLSS